MNKGIKNRFRVAILLLFICSHLAPALFSSALPPSEKWFLITIGDEPVGYVHEASSGRSTPAGEILVYTSDMKMVLNRLGSRVELELITASEETGEGLQKKLGYEMRASLMSTRTEAVVMNNTIEVRSESGGKSYTRSVPYSGPLLGQEGIRLLSLRKLKKPGDALEFQSFMPELGAVSKGRRKVLAAETLRLGEKEVPTLKVEEFVEAASIKSTAWLDSNGEVVKQEMPTPFGLSVFVLTDKARALRAASGTELPAEMYERSIIRSNIRLPKARSLEYLKVKLVPKNPGLVWPEIKSPYQAVVSKDRESLVLEIKRPRVPKPATFPAAVNDKNREFLQANAYIQSDEPQVQAPVRKIVGAEKDLFKASLKLERWVSENMEFDLGIALAPSSEIFKNRHGTCLGYATLLATMTRAAGIPSRVVMGYVYALGIFGGHAWTEVLAGEDWIPLDAAIVAFGQADAARLYFGTASMFEGAGSLGGGAGLQLLGQVDIKILAYAGADGKKIAVPEGAFSYRTSGDMYENPWLGLTLQKPADFKFTKLDAVWPDPTVAALEGPGDSKAELQEHFLLPWREDVESGREILTGLKIGGKTEIGKWKGLPCVSAKSRLKAALIIFDKPEAWVLVVEGQDAPKLMEKIAAGLEFQRKD